jgi:hypothetical protein
LILFKFSCLITWTKYTCNFFFEAGSTQATRLTAAKQIGDIAKSHPQDLHSLLKKVFFFFFILSYCVVVLCTWFFKVNWLAFVSTISISFAEKTLLKKKVASRGLCLVLMVEMPGFVFHLLCRWVDFQRLRLFNMNLLGKCYDLRVKVKLLCLLRVEWDINYKCVGWSF